MIIIPGFIDKRWLTIPRSNRRCVTGIRNVVVAPSSGMNIPVRIRRVYGYVVLDIEVACIRAASVKAVRTQTKPAVTDHSIVVGIYRPIIISENCPRTVGTYKSINHIVPDFSDVKAIICGGKIIQGKNTCCLICCGSAIRHPHNVA